MELAVCFEVAIRMYIVWKNSRITALKTSISVWCMSAPLLRKKLLKDGWENKIIVYEVLYNTVFFNMYVAAPRVVVGYYQGNRVRSKN